MKKRQESRLLKANTELTDARTSVYRGPGKHC